MQVNIDHYRFTYRTSADRENSTRMRDSERYIYSNNLRDLQTIFTSHFHILHPLIVRLARGSIYFCIRKPSNTLPSSKEPQPAN